MEKARLKNLRKVIGENTRVQKGGAMPIAYIDVANSLSDVGFRQNHVIFARRGCGKSLLLHTSATEAPSSTVVVDINCEDFKLHSFPNVLIEILDSIFKNLERDSSTWKIWSNQAKAKRIMSALRKELSALRRKADKEDAEMREARKDKAKVAANATAGLKHPPLEFAVGADVSQITTIEIEKKYQQSRNKIDELNTLLPLIKERLSLFFEYRKDINVVYIHVDDFYFFQQADQPLLMDYIHRLCKNMPMFFKVATLKHASTLFAARDGQPLGAQERNDYLPIDIDFSFENFPQTLTQNKQIFSEFESRAGLEKGELDKLFKGNGFTRLIIAGGGVPRDCLSLFLLVLDQVQSSDADGKIGKDDVRIASRENFNNRIAELKSEAAQAEQALLLRGIYVLRQMYLEKKSNVLLVSDELLQKDDNLKTLLFRLLDYRIVHSAGTALTHKSQPGKTFHALTIDIGCYAHMRVLRDKFTEIDLADPAAKDQMRSAPIFDEADFYKSWDASPENVEQALTEEHGACGEDVEGDDEVPPESLFTLHEEA
jgi:hypothetical protein